MPLATVLTDLNTELGQCDALVASAHQQDAGGVYLFPQRSREQITVAAFLNMFIAWESFLEASMCELMSGSATINGNYPVKFVSPGSLLAANIMIIGHQQYFDYSDPGKVMKITGIFFDSGGPYQPHLSAISQDIQDAKTIRNNCAHISSTTQTKLDLLARRKLGTLQVGITTYALLTAIDPSQPGTTVFQYFRNVLATASHLIAHG